MTPTGRLNWPAPSDSRRRYTPEVTDLGRFIAIIGVVLVVVGLAIMLAGRAGIPLGRLPGDIVYKGRNTTVYFPIVTCIVVSVVLSLILWLIAYFRR